MTNLPVLYDSGFAAWQQAPRWSWEYAGLFIYTVPSLPRTDFWDRIDDPILGRPMYFDRVGNPISIRQWGELREMGLDPDGHYGTTSYIRIGEDVVGDAKVSTVWLGIDHGWNRGEPGYKPVIFETMIFGGEYDNHLLRYCTEWEAIKGHAEAVTDLRAGMRPWWSYGGEEDDEWRSAPT